MMHSVALTDDPVVNEDEYVIVEPEDTRRQNAVSSMRTEQEEEYDLCEDVFPVFSLGEESRVGDLSSTPINLVPVLDEEESQGEDSPFNAPSASPNDKAESPSSLLSSTHQSKEAYSTSEDSLDYKSDIVDETASHPITTANVSSNHSNTIHKRESENTLKLDSSTSTTTKELACSKSRLSNKKRRKKMKLARKAAAAEAAAVLLRDKQPTPKESTKMTTSPPRVKASTTTGKKHVNLAVACATEAMAVYKIQVLGSKKISS